MTGQNSDRNPVELLADEFLERHRNGERPSVTEYTQRHPEHADAIRELFPMLLQMEDVADGMHEGPGNASQPALNDDHIGDYRVVREIGRGGMGVVYEAEQQSLGRRVALKVLPLHSAKDMVALERFRREARAAAKLHHTNIVPVFDVGAEGETCYYAMQYIQGRPLDLVIEELHWEDRASPATFSQSTQRMPVITPQQPLADAGPLPAGTQSAGTQSAGTQSAGTQSAGTQSAGTQSAGTQSTGTQSTGAQSTGAQSTGAQSTGAQAGRDPTPNQTTVSHMHDPVGAADQRQSSVTGATGELGEAQYEKIALAGGRWLSKTDAKHYFRSVAQLGRQVAEALAYAHSRGVIHRDIKPANLLLDASGVIWLTDFGMAKVGEESLTHTGDILGTIRYMAPERFKGECDTRADIYALGLTLYELLVLKPAFESKDRLQLIELISAKSPTPPRLLDNRIPLDLETIVLKSIERDPRVRYQSAQEISEDLEAFLEDRPVRARRIGVGERLVRWSRRNPVIAGLSVAFLFVLLTAVVSSSVAAYHFNRLAKSERDSKNLAEAAGVQADRRADELRRQDYVSRVNLAYYESMNDNVARAIGLLNGCPEDLRGWEWDFVGSRCEIALKSFEETMPSVNCLAFSPDGLRVAIGSGNFLKRRGNPGNLIVRDVKTGEVHCTQHGLSNGVMAVAYSPDGSRIASGNGPQLRVSDAETGDVIFTRPGDSLDLLCLAFSPGGRYLAAGFGEFNGDAVGYAKVWDAMTGEERHARIPGHTGGVWSLAFDPTGDRLVLTSDSLVEVWDVEKAASVLKIDGHRGFIYDVAYDPQGNYLATAGLDRTIRLWDAEDGRPVHIYRGHTGFVRGLAFSPDGKRIVSASEDKSLRLWEIHTERELATFRGHTHFVNCVCFNHDGTRFASGSLDQTVKLWFAAPEQQLVYRGHLDEGHVLGVDFDPRGTAVASSSFFFSGETDRLHLWDPLTGETLVRFPRNVGEVADVAFDRTGNLLAAAHPDGAVTLWDAYRSQLIARFDGHIGRVWTLEFSPDGSLLASAGEDGGMNVWSVESRTLMRSVYGHSDFVRDLAFSPDGRHVATAGDDGRVIIWNLKDGREEFVHEKHLGKVTGVAFSPDGQWIASTGGIHHRHGEVLIWNPKNGHELHRLSGHTDIVLDADFSPDGRRLATASDDRTIKLWDTEYGREVFTLRGHTGGVISVKFNPDGQRLASGSVDRTVRIWENRPASHENLDLREAVGQAKEGHARFEREQWKEAADAYRRALGYGLDRPEILVRCGIANARSGEARLSETDFAAANRMIAQDPRRAVDLAGFCARLGYADRASQVLLAASGSGLDPGVVCEAGRVLAEIGQLDASADAFARALSDFETRDSESPLDRPWLETGWWMSGPLNGDSDASDDMQEVMAPVEGRSLAAIAQAVHDSNWTSVDTDGDSYLALETPGMDSGNTNVFARQYVYAATEQDVAVLVGTNDALRFWMNGELVYSRIGTRFRRAAVAVRLRAGWNTFVIKLENTTGPPGAQIVISRHARDLASAASRLGDLSGVIRAWSEASETEKGDPQLLALAGDAFARTSDWKEACTVYNRLVERQPARNRNWVMLAPLLIQAGDLEGYRRHCRQILDLFGRTENPLIAERTSKACLILPDLILVSNLPAELALRAVKQGTTHRFISFFQLSHGMACYRTGDYEAASDALNTSLDLNTLRDPYLKVSTLLFLAMAQHHLNHPDQARRHYESATEVIGAQFPPAGSDDLGAAWSDWLVCEIVRREAEQLLGDVTLSRSE